VCSIDLKVVQFIDYIEWKFRRVANIEDMLLSSKEKTQYSPTESLEV